MERLDKFISSQTEYSRSDIKKLINKRKISVNNIIISKSDIKINPNIDKVYIDEKLINYKEYVYLILNKPKGYISATEDRTQQTVLELVPKEFRIRELFPAGRLDKDTTGLMIITDDGNFSHEIFSPKKHISKKYEVELDIPVTEEMKIGFKEGVKLNDGECKTANLEIIDKNRCIVTLTEGRYHQIKRMFGCFGAKVIELNRIAIGGLELPKNLTLGTCREMTEIEKNSVKLDLKP